jgi:hypothetical protein
MKMIVTAFSTAGYGAAARWPDAGSKRRIDTACSRAVLMAAGLSLVAMLMGDHNLADRIRDKTGTAGGHFCNPVSQSTRSQPLAAAGSLESERAGFEPAVRV